MHMKISCGLALIHGIPETLLKMFQIFIVCTRSHVFEKQLIHSVESVVIEWCHLIRDVLQKSSAETLLAGMNPGPLVEIEFWNSRYADLESVEDQVHVTTCATPSS
jgi:predicted RNase H-like nuclease